MRGVLFGVNNTKIVFSSVEADYSSDDEDDASTNIRSVATVVMPTDSLLQFCLFTLRRFASHKGILDVAMKENLGDFEKQLAEVAAIEVFKPAKSPAKRKRASKNLPAGE
ncbi:hypothetical protein [Burkholderia ubonensis]|uniref:hypothetical protein n=1 Tax=Burkholderia ubonensis TaxID=101571 RepID=UPI0018DF4994|nr:hypothetical protein [Burkholderia ubonensis]